MEKAPEFCILCGCRDREPLIEKDSWHVYRCSSCGLGFLDPRPSKEDIVTLYNKEYCDGRFVEGGDPDSPEFKKRLSLETHRIRFFRGIKKKGRVLDIGSGYGYFLATCRNYGYDVQGLDISGWASQHATEKLKIPITIGLMNEVELPAQYFDVITMWHFLEHTTDPRKAVLSARDWLKSDGILVVDVPNYEGTDARKSWKEWDGWDLPYHFFHFTPQSLKSLLSEYGFTVVKTKDYHSETVKKALKRIPVVSIFARLIAKMYSGHSIAVIARLDENMKAH
jgi:SAM-dependent methyltransferase